MKTATTTASVAWLRSIGLILCALTALAGASPELERARELYNRTDYHGSLELLSSLSGGRAEELFLAGQNHFMLGDYKRSSEAFQKATRLDSTNSGYFLWLGRAYGRRAELANLLSAAAYASKARQS